MNTNPNPDSAPDGARMPRRAVLKTTALAASAAASAMAADSAAAGKPSSPGQGNSVIEVENRKPGTTDWQLTRVRVNSGQYRTTLIEGYCSRQSVAVGDKLQVFVSTDPARRFQLDVYRMGVLWGHGRLPQGDFRPAGREASAGA